MAARAGGLAAYGGNPAVVLAVAVLMTAGVMVGLQPHLINHDVAQFMYGGYSALNGAILYRDFIEMNLPTVYYASALPMLLANAVGISPASALLVCVFVTVAVSVAASAHMLERSGLDRRPDLLLLVLAVELLPAFRHFGQREHLYAILTLPYVLSFLAPAPRGRWADWAVGVLAGLGLSLKVYFFVLPLFVEAAAGGRWWRGHRQSWVALAVGAACLAATLLRHPEYVLDLVPLARATYGGWEVPLITMLRNEGFSSSLLVLWLAARLPSVPQRAVLRRLLVAAVASGLAVATMQNKGYDYHFLPAIIPATMLLVVIAADLCALGAVPAVPNGGGVALWMTMALLAWDGARFARDGLRPFDYNETAAKLAPLVAQWGGGRPIAGLSVHVFPTFPYLLRHGGQWALRYPSLWPLVGYFKGGGTASPGPELQELRRMVVEDLEKQAPCLVFVDTWNWWKVSFPLVEFLSGEPHFTALWHDYRFVGEVDGYDLYSRCPPSSPMRGGS